MNGEVRAVDWNIPEEKRLTSHSAPSIWVERDCAVEIENGAIKPIHNDNIHILPYTEELWEGLQQLCTGIDELHRKLHVLLQTPCGLDQIRVLGSSVLGLLSDKGG